MITVHDTYSVFEANQVLTSSHLNDLFDYLDEQERLTRANLIGIGIECGLEIEFDADTATIHLSKGCGVTSQGYLIGEPKDLTLVSWRSYTLPDQIAYPTFEDAADPPQQLDLWELFPAGEPGTQPLSGGGLDLTDKAVVLFLELKRGGLRTCSPNNCDDRGAAITATVRRLLVKTTDLATVIAIAGGLGADATLADIEADLLARLQLPDLRIPRVDVPNTGPVTSEDVLRAFHQAFRTDGLAARTGAALTAAYQALKPLVGRQYPTNPFATFDATFGFLDSSPTTAVQVRFLQYYWDLFDDLLRAYDELRWSGVDLLCACCPPEGLFPRHLGLGVLDPESVAEPQVYRQRFLPSPALSRCEAQTRYVLVLFRRLVGMVEQFSNDPPLAPSAGKQVDEQIRITPSVWGDAPLGATAIPYYYQQGGASPLYQAWSPELARRGRAKQNLSYRSDEYGADTPSFVTDPLRYELEPHNFLRIEGHLGKDVRSAVNTLLSYRTQHRLPIEIIALRTGAFDETAPVDLAKQECRFTDLEAIYAIQKAELTCFLGKQVQYFYDLPEERESPVGTPTRPSLQLLLDYAPDYLVQPGTVGRLIEDELDSRRGGRVVVRVRRPAVLRTEFEFRVFPLVISMSTLAAQLGQDVHQLDFGAFDDRYQDLLDLAEQFEQARAAAVQQDGQTPFGAAGLADRINDIRFGCRLDPFRALQAEYQRRIRQAQQAQFFSFFQQQHPGIAHKAGAPLGGTFVLVYHQSAPPVPIPAVSDRVTDANDAALSLAFSNLQADPTLAKNPDVRTIFELLTGQILVGQPPKGERNAFVDTVAGLPDGTVIADFFLPYLCRSDCPPIQFTLPAIRPTVDLQLGCTNADGNAQVTLTAHGATGGVSVQVDGGPFEASTGTLLLAAGAHSVVVRDDTGSESAPTPVVVPTALTIGPERTIDDVQAGTYQVTFEVSGGRPPYSAAPGAVEDTAYTGPAVKSGEVVTVTITDDAGCTSEETFRHTVEGVCGLPCAGEAVRQGFRFWIPDAKPRLPLNDYAASLQTFRIQGPDGVDFDLTAEVEAVLNQAPNPLRSTDFDGTVGTWIETINALIAKAVGSGDWVRLEFEHPRDKAATGTLWIDRLVCLEVTFQLVVTFTQGQRVQRFEIGYSSKGTSLTNPEAGFAVFVPAFNPATSNKCHPEQPPVDVCREVGLQLDFKQEGFVPDSIMLIAGAAGNDVPTDFLWEVQDASPALANGEAAKFVFDPVEPTEKLVRLTAFTEKGCAAVVERIIQIKG